MGTTAGIGIGIAIGIALTLSIVVFAGINLGTTLENIPALVYAEPRLAYLQASYDEFDDKTTVSLSFTDNDANYVKADGDVKITLCQEIAFTDDLTRCFTNSFSFDKGGFVTWQDNTGRKITSHQFTINGELSGGWWWQASAEITLEDGTYWADVDTRFWSSDD